MRPMFFLCGLSLLFACVQKQVKVPSRKVLDYGKDYSSWHPITKRKVISSNHGDTEEKIYANGKAYGVSSGKSALPYPEGASFLMLRYKDGELLPQVYLMRKMGSDYHSDYNNWRYSIVRKSDWTIEDDGKLPSCIRCHFKHRARDYIPLMKKDGM